MQNLSSTELYKNKFYLKKLCRKERSSLSAEKILISLSTKLKILFLFLLLLPNFAQSNESLDLVQIDINTAPLEDLVKIIHIGEKRAIELISLRPFSSLDDLIKIKGIGEARIQDIKKQGLAWIAESQIEKTEPAEIKPAGVGSLQVEDEEVIETKTPIIITYPTGIIINEILPSPEGPDAENEWIEIFNQNNFIVLLTDWKIKDSKGSIHTFVFSKTAQILAKEFLVLSRKITKITLNNDGDEISIIHPDGKIIDKVSFEKAPRAQSYNRAEASWFWSAILTPGAVNIVSVSSQPEQVKKTNFQKEVEKNLSKKELAFIGEQALMPTNTLSVFLIALFLAIFSGIIILVLKRKKS